MIRTLSLIIILIISTCQISVGQYAWTTLHDQAVSGQHQLHTSFASDTLISVSEDIGLDESNNPNIISNPRLKISVSGVGSLFSNGLSIDDVSFVEDKIRFIDFDLSKDQVLETNIFGYESQMNFLHLDYRLGKGSLRFGYTYRTFGNFNFDQSLFTLLSDGNEAFVGQTIALDPQVSIANYHQIYLGYSGKISNLSYTVQAKFLSGVGHLETDQSSINLSISDDIYQLNFSNDYRIRTSRILKYNEIDDTEISYRSIDFDRPFKGNYGLGFDLGLSYELNGKHRVFVNAYDIGSIAWSNLTRTYVSQGNISYNGLDLVEFFDSDETIGIIDSLRSLLEVEEDLSDYTSTLPAQFVLGLDYQLSELNNIGLIVSSTTLVGNEQLTANISAGRQFSKKIKAGLSYTYANEQHGVGLHGLLNFGKLKLVFATNHVPAFFNLTGSSMISARGGLSVEF